MNKIHLIYTFAIAVLVALLCLSLNRNKEVEVVEKRVTDTLYQIRWDTIVEYTPKYISKTVIDTLYIPTKKDTTIQLPIERKYYTNDSTYEAWVSGYNPNLDSIKTFPKIVNRTIINDIERRVIVNTFDLYPYMGFRRFNDKIKPSVGVMAKTKKNTLYGLEIGLDENSDVFFGLNIGYKIN